MIYFFLNAAPSFELCYPCIQINIMLDNKVLISLHTKQVRDVEPQRKSLLYLEEIYPGILRDKTMAD